MLKTYLCLIITVCVLACSSPPNTNEYKYLLNRLQSQNAIELTDNDGKARLIISPLHQGKVIASTYNGLSAPYNGWVNQSILKDSSKLSAIGGEERLWIGPLGSQFSFYFQQKEPIHDDNWKVPETMNAEPYNLIHQGENHIELIKEMQLTNFVGTIFNLKVNRKISILIKKVIQKHLNIKLDNTTNYVAFETKHKLTNLDTVAWTKETGLVGLWSAGMYQGTDDTVVIIPLKNDGNRTNILTYLGSIDHSRLIVKNNTLLFKTDGKYRSKIGVPPEFSPSTYGCYSKVKNRLTIVQYKKDNDSLYPNSYVSIQENPFKGEAIPIYNNGSDFFELESHGSLKPLMPKASISHWHRVYHFSDNEYNLNKLSRELLGVDLALCKLE